MAAKEFIKARHNGELPYQYGTNECATLMEDYAKHENEALQKQVEELCKHATHKKTCQGYYQGGVPCTCGLNELLEQALKE